MKKLDHANLRTQQRTVPSVRNQAKKCNSELTESRSCGEAEPEDHQAWNHTNTRGSKARRKTRRARRKMEKPMKEEKEDDEDNTTKGKEAGRKRKGGGVALRRKG